MMEHFAIQLGKISAALFQSHPWLVWAGALLLLVRFAATFARWRFFQRLKMPGVPRWPSLYRAGKVHLIRCNCYLTPWRYFFVSRLSALAAWLARFALLALLISFIPHPLVATWFSTATRLGLIAYIIGAVILDRTRLHRMLGCWTMGATTEVLVSSTHVVVLRFLFVLIPWVRVYRREPELGLSAGLEPHEQAGEEDKSGRPVFAEAFHVVLRLGHRPIRAATVFGRIEAERMAGSFAALREELQKQRGVNQRKITHSAWSFGQAEPRAE